MNSVLKRNFRLIKDFSEDKNFKFKTKIPESKEGVISSWEILYNCRPVFKFVKNVSDHTLIEIKKSKFYLTQSKKVVNKHFGRLKRLIRLSVTDP